MNLILRDIVSIVSKSLEIKPDDTNTITLVKNATNEAYMLLCKTDKRIARGYIPIVNGIATIPENSLGIMKCTPQLDITDRIYGNSIVTDKEGILEILYFYARDLLIEDEDEIDLHLTLQQGIINFVCYIVCLGRNELNQAESFYNAYMRNISQYEQNDLAIPETILEV